MDFAIPGPDGDSQAEQEREHSRRVRSVEFTHDRERWRAEVGGDLRRLTDKHGRTTFNSAPGKILEIVDAGNRYVVLRDVSVTAMTTGWANPANVPKARSSVTYFEPEPESESH